MRNNVRKAVFIGVIGMMVLLRPFPADCMEVTIIGGEDATDSETVSLDDIVINKPVEIDNYGIICATDFKYLDTLGHFRLTDRERYDEYTSGEEADYAVLQMNITNTKLTAKNYLAQISVRVIYDDAYEYEGWAYQYDYNRSRWDEELSKEVVIDAEENFSIKPMYIGHYAFGCTLPNPVITSKAPLRMIIEIDGNEIIYNVRK